MLSRIRKTWPVNVVRCFHADKELAVQDPEITTQERSVGVNDTSDRYLRRINLIKIGAVEGSVEAETMDRWDISAVRCSSVIDGIVVDRVEYFPHPLWSGVRSDRYQTREQAIQHVEEAGGTFSALNKAL